MMKLGRQAPGMDEDGGTLVFPLHEHDDHGGRNSAPPENQGGLRGNSTQPTGARITGKSGVRASRDLTGNSGESQERSAHGKPVWRSAKGGPPRKSGGLEISGTGRNSVTSEDWDAQEQPTTPLHGRVSRTIAVQVAQSEWGPGESIPMGNGRPRGVKKEGSGVDRNSVASENGDAGEQSMKQTHGGASGMITEHTTHSGVGLGELVPMGKEHPKGMNTEGHGGDRNSVASENWVTGGQSSKQTHGGSSGVTTEHTTHRGRGLGGPNPEGKEHPKGAKIGVKIEKQGGQPTSDFDAHTKQNRPRGGERGRKSTSHSQVGSRGMTDGSRATGGGKTPRSPSGRKQTSAVKQSAVMSPDYDSGMAHDSELTQILAGENLQYTPEGMGSWRLGRKCMADLQRNLGGIDAAGPILNEPAGEEILMQGIMPVGKGATIPMYVGGGIITEGENQCAMAALVTAVSGAGERRRAEVRKGITALWRVDGTGQDLKWDPAVPSKAVIRAMMKEGGEYMAKGRLCFVPMAQVESGYWRWPSEVLAEVDGGTQVWVVAYVEPQQKHSNGSGHFVTFTMQRTGGGVAVGVVDDTNGENLVAMITRIVKASKLWEGLAGRWKLEGAGPPIKVVPDHLDTYNRGTPTEHSLQVCWEGSPERAAQVKCAGEDTFATVYRRTFGVGPIPPGTVVLTVEGVRKMVDKISSLRHVGTAKTVQGCSFMEVNTVMPYSGRQVTQGTVTWRACRGGEIYETKSLIDDERTQWNLAQVLQCDTGLTRGDCLDPVTQGGSDGERGIPTEVRPLSWKCTVQRLQGDLGGTTDLTVMIDLGKAPHDMGHWLWLGPGISATDPKWEDPHRDHSQATRGRSMKPHSHTEPKVCMGGAGKGRGRGKGRSQGNEKGRARSASLKRGRPAEFTDMDDPRAATCKYAYNECAFLASSKGCLYGGAVAHRGHPRHREWCEGRIQDGRGEEDQQGGDTGGEEDVEYLGEEADPEVVDVSRRQAEREPERAREAAAVMQRRRGIELAEAARCRRQDTLSTLQQGRGEQSVGQGPPAAAGSVRLWAKGRTTIEVVAAVDSITGVEALEKLGLPPSVYCTEEGILWGVIPEKAMETFRLSTDMVVAWRMGSMATMREFGDLARYDLRNHVILPVPVGNIMEAVPVWVTTKGGPMKMGGLLPVTPGTLNVGAIMGDMVAAIGRERCNYTVYIMRWDETDEAGEGEYDPATVSSEDLLADFTFGSIEQEELETVLARDRGAFDKTAGGEAAQGEAAAPGEAAPTGEAAQGKEEAAQANGADSVGATQGEATSTGKASAKGGEAAQGAAAQGANVGKWQMWRIAEVEAGQVHINTQVNANPALAGAVVPPRKGSKDRCSMVLRVSARESGQADRGRELRSTLATLHRRLCRAGMYKDGEAMTALGDETLQPGEGMQDELEARVGTFTPENPEEEDEERVPEGTQVGEEMQDEHTFPLGQQAYAQDGSRWAESGGYAEGAAQRMMEALSGGPNKPNFLYGGWSFANAERFRELAIMTLQTVSSDMGPRDFLSVEDRAGWYGVASAVVEAPSPQRWIRNHIKSRKGVGNSPEVYASCVDVVLMVAVVQHEWNTARKMWMFRDWIHNWQARDTTPANMKGMGLGDDLDLEESDESVQDWALEQALLQKGLTLAVCDVSELQHGVVLDAGIRHTGAPVQVLVAQPGERNGRQTMTRWVNLDSLGQEGGMRWSTYCDEYGIPEDEEEVRDLVRENRIGNWAGRLGCYQVRDPSYTVGTRIRYVEKRGKEEEQEGHLDVHEISVIHSHTGDAGARVYRVSWAGVTDEEVIAEEGEEALLVPDGDMAEGPILQAYLEHMAGEPAAREGGPIPGSPALETAQQELEALKEQMRAQQDREDDIRDMRARQWKAEAEAAEARRRVEGETARQALANTELQLHALHVKMANLTATHKAQQRAEGASGQAEQDGTHPGGRAAQDFLHGPRQGAAQDWLAMPAVPASACETCGGLFNTKMGEGHSQEQCPGEGTVSREARSNMAIGRAAASVLTERRAEEVLAQVNHAGTPLMRTYPTALLREDEGSQIRAKAIAIMREAECHTAGKGGKTEEKTEVDQLREQLATERAESRRLAARMVAATNATQGIGGCVMGDGQYAAAPYTTMGTSSFMDSFSYESGRTQMEHAMRVLSVGGEHGNGKRIMMVVAAAIHGYNHKCQAVTSNGIRRIAMNLPAIQFKEKVKYSTDPTSLWMREAKAIEKVDDGMFGVQVVDGVMRAGRTAVRTLPEAPSTRGWREKFMSITDWGQALVEYADHLEDVDGEFQHVYSPEHMLHRLMNQHRKSFTTQVWETQFVGMRNKTIALENFVALEAKVRSKMMVDKPRSWEYDRAGPYMTVVRDFVLQAERESQESMAGEHPGHRDSRRGLPPAGAGVPGAPGPATPTRPRATPRVDHKDTESFDTFDKFRDAYKDVKTKRGNQYCLRFAYDNSCTYPVSTDGGVTRCTDAGGGVRVHLCLRCSKEHTPKGKGACDEPHVR